MYAPIYGRLDDLPRDLGGTGPPMDNTHNVTQLRDTQPYLSSAQGLPAADLAKTVLSNNTSLVLEWLVISEGNFFKTFLNMKVRNLFFDGLRVLCVRLAVSLSILIMVLILDGN